MPRLNVIDSNTTSVELNIDYKWPFKHFEIQSKEFMFSNKFNRSETCYRKFHLALNLVEDRCYYFRARTMQDNGKWSDWGDELQVRTPKRTP